MKKSNQAIFQEIDQLKVRILELLGQIDSEDAPVIMDIPVSETQAAIDHLNELQLKKLVDTASIAILVIDQTGRILIGNQLAADYFLYEQRELSGIYLDQLLPVHLREKHAQHMKAYFANPKPRLMGTSLELLAQKRDGTQFPVEISLSTISSEGRTLGVAFIVDISKRKLSQIQQAESVKQLLTNIGHDLKTPMTAIITRLYLLRHALSGNMTQHTDILTEHIQRLDQLVERMLNMAQLDATEQIEPVATNLNQLILDIIKTHVEHARSKEIELDYDLDSTLPKIPMDANMVSDALRQLVENALIYTPDKGRIHIKTQMQDTHVLITIEDTGIGIPADELAYIFEHFYRVDKARQVNESLNGLGLALVKRVVDLHQGRIEVESKLDEGSIFKIFLPK